MGSVAVHRIQHKLHLLHHGIFPLLQDKGIPSEDTACSEENGIVGTICEPEQDGKECDSLSRTASQSEDSGSPDLEIGEEGALIEEDSNEITERTLTSYKKVSNIFSLIRARTFCSIHLRPRRGLDR
jgi:hypothetical protein